MPAEGPVTPVQKERAPSFGRCPGVIAGDPAPQQLTAPCRKYSGRLHHSIEQAAYPMISLDFPLFSAKTWKSSLTPVTKSYRQSQK
jgi:hypothetical protein